MPFSHIVKHISPMLAVADMKGTLQFYSDVLGFSTYMESSEYSIIERNGFPIHLMKATDQSVLDAVRGHTEIYVEVSDIHSLWNHVQTFRDRYKTRDLFEREYGMTEFHIADPNDCLIFVGERTASIMKTEGAAANP
jgi:catechol 2,3-dioxygenase-like lactoylglutathione lyase family enzyme